MPHIILHECIVTDTCFMDNIKQAGFNLSNPKKSGRHGNLWVEISGPGILETDRIVVLRYNSKTKEVSVKK